MSIPRSTAAGAASQTQEQAQAGTNTAGAIKDVTTTDQFVEKGKLDLVLFDFFPFCIPYDIVRGVKLLMVPARAPVFNIPLQLPYVGTRTIHIDLTQWDGAFAVGRWFLTFMFCIALAGATQKVIKW